MGIANTITSNGHSRAKWYSMNPGLVSLHSYYKELMSKFKDPSMINEEAIHMFEELLMKMTPAIAIKKNHDQWYPRQIALAEHNMLKAIVSLALERHKHHIKENFSCDPYR